MVWRANNLRSGYLKKHLSPYCPTQPLQSTVEAILVMPQLMAVWLAATGGKDFYAEAPTQWNHLPHVFKQALTLLMFRQFVLPGLCWYLISGHYDVNSALVFPFFLYFNTLICIVILFYTTSRFDLGDGINMPLSSDDQDTLNLHMGRTVWKQPWRAQKPCCF